LTHEPGSSSNFASDPERFSRFRVDVTKTQTPHSGQRLVPHAGDESYYSDLKRRQIVRLFLSYVAPIILLSVFFYFNYESLAKQSRRAHISAVADNRASTLDLYLSERQVNLSNLIDDPRLPIPPTSKDIAVLLDKLKTNSETFVDLGYFDAQGIQVAYAGPYPSLEKRSYRAESWYEALKAEGAGYVITDVYLGFREQPHFTIGVSRTIDDQFVALRATLDPQRIYDYISPAQDTAEVYTSIINAAGFYQLVSPKIGRSLESSSIMPPRTPPYGVEDVKVEGREVTYAYCWLSEANWALIVQPTNLSRNNASGFRLPFIGIVAAIILVLMLLIISRSRTLVGTQMESDRTRAQLEHAAKLASVGELASGIAHEINNPLAVISEQTGLMKDYLSPEFNKPLSREELIEHFNLIEETVYRCRAITRKLLKFVRQEDVVLKHYNVQTLIDNVVDGILGHEMVVSNIEAIRIYDPELPELRTDGNQLEQVVLNIINNAVDAIGDKPGKITIATSRDNNTVRVAITDTGHGMSQNQLQQIFVPFFTTKEVGKGTGLGLSVSYGIMKNLGGDIEVESRLGSGTTFTLVLPIR
jgi:two-component system NtrC family sensor kinase